MSLSEVRTQIYLTYEQHRLLKRRARLENKMMAQIIRQAIEQYLGIDDEGKHLRKDDPIWKLAGICRSGVRDGSIHHDHYLYGAKKKR